MVPLNLFVVVLNPFCWTILLRIDIDDKNGASPENASNRRQPAQQVESQTMLLFNLLLFTAALLCISAQSHDLIGWAARDTLVPKFADFTCYGAQPGFYCRNDLAGYYSCKADGSEEFVACSQNLRCSCFARVRCDHDIANLCQPVNLPPKLPEDITTVSTGVQSVRTPYVSRDYKFTKQQFQASSSKVTHRRGDRQDTQWVGTDGKRNVASVQNTYVADGNAFTLYKAQLTETGGTCLLTANGVTSLPVIQIPAGAMADGFEIVNGEKANRWHLMTAGSYRGTATTVEYFYYVQDTVRQLLRPIRYFARFNYGPTTKVSVTVNETYGLFYAQLVPSVGFYAIKPAVC